MVFSRKLQQHTSGEQMRQLRKGVKKRRRVRRRYIVLKHTMHAGFHKKGRGHTEGNEARAWREGGAPADGLHQWVGGREGDHQLH